MAVPKEPKITPVVIVNKTLGTEVDTVTIAGIVRLRVEAILAGAGGVYAQGDFDSAPADETNAFAIWARAAVTGRDQTLGATVQNIPIEARGAVAAQAYALKRLFVDGVVRGDDGATYSAVGTRAAVAAQAYALQRLLVDGVVRGDDGVTYSAVGAVSSPSSGQAQAFGLVRLFTDAVMFGDDGANYTPVAVRQAGTDLNFAKALFGSLVNSRLAGYETLSADFVRLSADKPDNFNVAGLPIAAASLYSLWTNSLMVGINTAGAVMKPIESAGAVAAQAYALQRLFVDGVVRGDDGATYSAVGTRAAVAAQAYALQRLLVDGVVRGDDGATYTAIATRAADTDAKFAKALFGLTANARLGAVDTVTADYARLFADVPSAYISVGRALTAIEALWTSSLTVGVDRLTGTDELMPVEAIRANVADGASRATSLAIVQSRGSGFAAALYGRRFTVTHQTPGTGVTGQTSFAATTPTFMFRNNAGTKKIVLRSMALTQIGTIAGGLVNIVIATDSADRFSAGGTAVTPQGTNKDNFVASALTSFLYNPTATAAGGGTSYYSTHARAAALGDIFSLDTEDSLEIGTTGAILIYTWAGTTGPTWAFTFDYEEMTA